MGGENGGAVNLSLFAQGKSYTGEPFVELSNNGAVPFSRDELQLVSRRGGM